MIIFIDLIYFLFYGPFYVISYIFALYFTQKQHIIRIDVIVLS